MTQKIYLARKQKKDGSGEYIALTVDLGYRLLNLSFNTMDFAEALGVPVRYLWDNIKLGELVEVGELNTIN